MILGRQWRSQKFMLGGARLKDKIRNKKINLKKLITKYVNNYMIM